MTTHWTVGKGGLKCSAMVGNATRTLPRLIAELKVPIAMVPKSHYL